MKMKLKFNLLLSLVAMVLLVVVPGFAQNDTSGQDGSGTSGGSSSKSGADSHSSVVFNQNSKSSPGFVEAVPGNIPPIFPGNAPGIQDCGPIRPPASFPQSLSKEQLKAMAQGTKVPHGKEVTPIAGCMKDGGSSSDSLVWMSYNPRVSFNPGDEQIGSTMKEGKFLHTDEQTLAAAALGLWDKFPCMQRVAFIACRVNASVTHASSHGIGFVTSGTPGSGNVAGSGAIGWSGGKTATEDEAKLIVYAYAMNGGEPNLIPPPEKDEGEGKGAPPPQNTPAPEVKEKPAAPPQAPPPPPPVAATCPPPPPPLTLPDIELHYAFNCDNVDGECIQHGKSADPGWKARGDANVAALRTLRDWLVQHPGVKVDVKGSTDHYASTDYNAALGYRRARHVVDYLRAHFPEIERQLYGPDSSSKYHAVPTGPKDAPDVAANRAVIFEIHGPDSSRKNQP